MTTMQEASGQALSPMNPNVIDKILLGIAFGLCVFFVANIHQMPYTGVALIKWLPIGILATVVWRQRASKWDTVMVIAILLHSVGDVLLVIDRQGLFLPAVSVFLIGHVFWVVIFAQYRLEKIPFTRWFAVLGAVAVGLAVGAQVVAKVGPIIAVGLAIYGIALVLMAALSAISKLSPMVFIGACFYMASDAVVSLNKFVVDVPMDHHLASSTYFIAQGLIVLGYLASRPKEQ